MRVITVIPFKKGPFSENLTYFSSQDIAPGKVVSIELRSKKILGLVVSSRDASELKADLKRADFNLKKIEEVKEKSIFRTEFLDAAKKTAAYSASPENSVAAALLPSVIRENYDSLARIVYPIENNNSEERNIRSEKLLLQESLEDRIAFHKTLIRGAFAEKKSVFIVLPTAEDINFWHEALSKGIEQFAFTLHGSIGPKKLLKTVEDAISTVHPVVIFGTAPFLSIPRYDIKTIIVEHESAGYKTLARPFIDLRVFAEVFAASIGAKFILADTLLRYESLARKEEGFSLARPINWRHKFGIDLEIVDSRKKQNEKWRVFPTETLYKMERNLEQGKNIFIFSLRKGLATETVCRDCGESLTCEKCGAPLVLYKTRQEDKRIFMCNRCNVTKDPDTKCPYCRSWNLYSLGVGTDTVYEEAKKLFPKTKIFKLDKEEAKSKKEAEKIVSEFEKPGSKSKERGAILIGTELALLYLKEKVALSVVASLDTLWSIPNFKMSERVLALILNIISKTEKNVLIQTKNQSEEVLTSLVSGNLSIFIKEELQDRKRMGYPPYKRFIKITHTGSKTETAGARTLIPELFEEYSPLIFKGFAPKNKDKFITNVLIKKDNDDWSLPELTYGTDLDLTLLQKLLSLPPSFSVDVDPDSLL